MPEFLIILNAIGAVIVIGTAIGGVFFYLSRQVSRINEMDRDVAGIRRELAASVQQRESDRLHIRKMEQRTKLLLDWVNLLRMSDETTRTNIALGMPFTPLEFGDDE